MEIGTHCLRSIVIFETWELESSVWDQYVIFETWKLELIQYLRLMNIWVRLHL